MEHRHATLARVAWEAVSTSDVETLREKRLQLSALEIPAGRGWSPLRERVTDTLCDHPSGIGDVITKLVTVHQPIA